MDTIFISYRDGALLVRDLLCNFVPFYPGAQSGGENDEQETAAGYPCVAARVLLRVQKHLSGAVCYRQIRL